MADNASPKTEPRNQRNTGNNRPLGDGHFKTKATFK